MDSSLRFLLLFYYLFMFYFAVFTIDFLLDIKNPNMKCILFFSYM